jgi:hypothetical protein
MAESDYLMWAVKAWHPAVCITGGKMGQKMQKSGIILPWQVLPDNRKATSFLTWLSRLPDYSFAFLV